jgi:glycosyltransferase involved in cell wall biosynthesis
MRIAIVADACDPPTNGVSRTLTMLSACLERQGHEVRLISPPGFLTLPCPSQPDIRLAVAPGRRLARLLDAFAPEAVHIATEGPLGLAARRLCLRRGWPFTTMFTSKFAETIHARLRVPVGWTWALLRWFHAPSSAVMVSTGTLRADLARRGFRRLATCGRGVDTSLFRPRPDARLPHPRPIWLYVGRVAPEKSVEDFLGLDLPGTKLVVGDGPALPGLRQRFPDAVFAGTRRGEELAWHYAASDVFVFPSRTDTFVLVVLEALASGLPVAAYPVTGPIDIIGDSGAGVLDEDLGRAARAALEVPRERCRALAETYSWERCAHQFRALLCPIPNEPPPLPRRPTVSVDPS